MMTIPQGCLQIWGDPLHVHYTHTLLEPEFLGSNLSPRYCHHGNTFQ